MVLPRTPLCINIVADGRAGCPQPAARGAVRSPRPGDFRGNQGGKSASSPRPSPPLPAEERVPEGRERRPLSSRSRLTRHRVRGFSLTLPARCTCRILALVTTLLGVGLLAVLSTGCRANGPRPPRIALIMKSLANEFFLTMEQGARAHQQAHASAYELIANGTKDEQDINKQIDLVEQMIAERVDAIVIAPADSKALVPVCRKAQQAGIVVVNIDNRFDQAVLADQHATIPFVGPDNRKGAREVGEYLAKRLHPGDPVAIIEGIPGAFNAIQRRLGFEDALHAAGARIVSVQSGYWETDKANQVVAPLLTEHPDLKALLCSNDSMALGAVAALRAAGKVGKVLVVGFDNITAVHQLLQDGTILATVDQHGDQLAVYGIEYALEMLQHKGTPADRETPVDLITANTVTP
ncbi:MAG: sugar ABC transporter substrate-binding protein [Verrucomicrobia bacterium]|nr:sugar ABC transporter substrate-binding protein [Verrucomicrobiota bacterium]